MKVRLVHDEVPPEVSLYGMVRKAYIYMEFLGENGEVLTYKDMTQDQQRLMSPIFQIALSWKSGDDKAQILQLSRSFRELSKYLENLAISEEYKRYEKTDNIVEEY